MKKATVSAASPALLISNVGNRDVSVEGIDPVKEGGVRTCGERILASFDRYAGSIRLPILDPALDYLAHLRHRPIHVALLTTDQRDSDRRGQDTLHSGEIMRRVLAARGIVAELLPICGVNPADHDAVADPMREALDRLRASFDTSKHPVKPQIYLNLSPGTPALITNLVLCGMESFEGFDLNTISIDPSGVAKQRRMPERFSRITLVHLVKGFLKSYDFLAAAQTLEELGRNDLSLAARYAHARLDFNFDTALDFRRKLLKRIDPESAFAKRFENLKPAIGDLAEDAGEGVDTLRLVELYHAACVIFLCRSLTDYLARIRCLLELVIERFCAVRGIVTNVPDKEAHRFMASLDASPVLKKWLEGVSINGQRLDLRRPSFPVLKSIVQYFLYFEVKNRPLGQLMEKLIQETTDRNKTVIAHGTEGISAERLAVKDLAPDGLPRKVFEGLGMTLGSSPYDALADMIAKELRAKRKP